MKNKENPSAVKRFYYIGYAYFLKAKLYLSRPIEKIKIAKREYEIAHERAKTLKSIEEPLFRHAKELEFKKSDEEYHNVAVIITAFATVVGSLCELTTKCRQYLYLKNPETFSFKGNAQKNSYLNDVYSEFETIKEEILKNYQRIKDAGYFSSEKLENLVYRTDISAFKSKEEFDNWDSEIVRMCLEVTLNLPKCPTRITS